MNNETTQSITELRDEFYEFWSEKMKQGQLSALSGIERCTLDIAFQWFIVRKEKESTSLKDAIGRLSEAMGNPAVQWNEDSSIETAVIIEATRVLLERK